ncbi:hypothetical protein LBMAG48_08450 [Phycisphaerae bacterium]|jgi:XapX domain-containing protein|nr:hypothetical protein LBMAG48_08450 [Phycisphaerae bacterium]
MKFVIGLILAFLIGAGCRVFDIPAPAPPMLTGALLVFAMTGGYMSADKYMKSRVAQPAPIVSPAATTPDEQRTSGPK